VPLLHVGEYTRRPVDSADILDLTRDSVYVEFCWLASHWVLRRSRVSAPTRWPELGVAGISHVALLLET